jgi:hypothetical protein
VSIVTVFNDPAMREACLDRSIDAHRVDAPEIELIPVDNANGAFSSAGAALNHGAALARHDYIAFVHQDVYLHSLVALEEAAGRLANDQQIGLLGAIGVTPDSRFFGYVRDRIFLLGEPVSIPVDVDTVDELLFVIPRRVLEREPLPEDRDLAWHAYAVEYGLRLRAQGMRVCAADIPVTHNSLTGNLDRLDVAYATIAANHPQALPVVTPQGIVQHGGRARDRKGFLSEHRWRYRWLRESLDAEKGRRAAGGAPCLLVDIRQDIDDLLARLLDAPPLLVINSDRECRFVDEQPGPLSLPRGERVVNLTSRTPEKLGEAVAATPAGRPILLTNLTLEDVRRLTRNGPPRERVLGYWTSLGYWMLIDVPLEALPDQWRAPRATPMGARKPRR